jgi:amino acid transporter
MSAVEGTEQDQVSRDAAQLATLGYAQQLRRVLTLWQNFAVGFTYLSPVVGVYGLFAYGLATAGPRFIWWVPVVVAGQFLVALSFGEVVSEYPVAGGMYQWAKHLIGPRYAWFSGWMYGWALLITSASIAFAAAPFIAPLFGFAVTRWTTIGTALVILAVACGLNSAGVRRVGQLATLGVIAEIIGTVVIGIILLVGGRHHGFGSLFSNAGITGSGGYFGGYLGAFFAAALFSVWIFYGFEACGDVAEEVIDPSRKAPRAMRYALLWGGLVSFFITMSYIMATPNFAAVISGKDANPIYTALYGTLGSAGAKTAIVMILVAFLSCATSEQTAGIRLLFSYGRDGMLVGGRFLSTVSSRFGTPLGAVAVATIIPAIILFLPTATIARIIDFAVVGIYAAFQLVVLAAIVARTRGWQPSGPFNLRSWGWPVNVVAFVYGVGAIVILSIKSPPSGTSFFDKWLVPISLGIVAAAGLAYLVILRPRPKIREDAQATPPQAAVQA